MEEELEPYISAEEISEIVVRLAGEIARDYEGKPLLLLGILKGSYAFVADLARALPLATAIDFVRVRSYGDGAQPGALRLESDISHDVTQTHVLLAEDILDTGGTLHFLKEHLCAKKPLSLKICALLDKPARRGEDISADYVGKTIEDAFVVGYGLDYAERYRGLPYIAKLKLPGLQTAAPGETQTEKRIGF